MTSENICLKICIDNTIVVPNTNPTHLCTFFLQSRNNKMDFQADDGTPCSLEIVNTIKDAQFCILPFTWNQYVASNLVSAVIALARQHSDKYFILWATGDHEVIIPISNAIQFQNGLHRSIQRAPEFTFELPAFWPDYLDLYFEGQMQIREKRHIPSIGFCGQANARCDKIVYWTARNLLHASLYRLNLARHIPPPIQPSVVMRRRVLETLSTSSSIQTDYIIRTRYRAGIRNKLDRDNAFHPTKVEFVQNINNNDYTVCLRGGGNFSVRFYETLSCGRIPIFIDTDSRLPFDFLLNWKDIIVYIDQSQISYLPEAVLDFHRSLSNEEFIERQLLCRQLWLQWVSKDGFLNNFYKHLLYVMRNSRQYYVHRGVTD